MWKLADCTADMGSIRSAAASFYNVWTEWLSCWTSDSIYVVGERSKGDGAGWSLHVGTGAGKSAKGQLKL